MKQNKFIYGFNSVVEEKRKAFELFTKNKRLRNLLWVDLINYFPHLKEMHRSSFSFDALNSCFINRSINEMETYFIQLSGSLLGARNLDWIVDGARQASWLEKSFGKLESVKRGLLPTQLSDYEKSIALIDHWMYVTKTRIVDGEEIMMNLRRDWDLKIKFDKKLSWVDEGSIEGSRGYLWKWLELNKFPMPLGRSEFSNHDEVLIFFDNLENSEKESIPARAKKAWIQKCSRSKSYDGHVKLSQSLSKKLAKISASMGIDEEEVVKALIEREYLMCTQRKN